MIRFPLPALVPVLLLALLGCAQPPTSPAEPKVEAPSVAVRAEPRPSPKPRPPVAEAPSVAEQWAAAFSKGDLDALMSLYDEDALFWGTSSSQIRKGSSAIRQYYAQVLTGFPGIQVSLEQTSPRRYGDTGVNSGSFSMRRIASSGNVSVTSGRFSMVYVWRGGKWLIVDHHSSLATR